MSHREGLYERLEKETRNPRIKSSGGTSTQGGRLGERAWIRRVVLLASETTKAEKPHPSLHSSVGGKITGGGKSEHLSAAREALLRGEGLGEQGSESLRASQKPPRDALESTTDPKRGEILSRGRCVQIAKKGGRSGGKIP